MFKINRHIYKCNDPKTQIEQHQPHPLKTGMISSAPEGQTISAPLVSPVVLLLKAILCLFMQLVSSLQSVLSTLFTFQFFTLKPEHPLEQDLLTLYVHMRSSRILRGSCCSTFSLLCNVLQIIICPFVPVFTIVLSVLRITSSDYHFDIFKPTINIYRMAPSNNGICSTHGKSTRAEQILAQDLIGQ